MDPSLLLSQLFNGVALGLLYVLMATGLTIIMGTMGVVNFSHGILFTFGAYFAYSVAAKFGFWAALLHRPGPGRGDRDGPGDGARARGSTGRTRCTASF